MKRLGGRTALVTGAARHRAEDLTEMAMFLASAENDYIVGRSDTLDGGNWLS